MRTLVVVIAVPLGADEDAAETALMLSEAARTADVPHRRLGQVSYGESELGVRPAMLAALQAVRS